MGITPASDEGRPEYAIGMAVLLSAMLLSLVIYFAASGIQQSVVKLGVAVIASSAQCGGQTGNSTAQPTFLPLEKEVTVDFLYADWCPHCQKMKPIVAKLEQELPKDRFVVRYWKDEDASSDPKVSAVYDKYTKAGYFTGFPTFVINNGAEYKAGEMSESDLRAWICSKFSAPKPSGC
ncbi:MAG: thioredoxin family protein [Candidatus Micrarchaeota archaeon]|nr:thioredoxin family protein [Candidatus Micrarchaeota archaeon]